LVLGSWKIKVVFLEDWRLLLYYITDRQQFPGDEAAQRRLLLAKIAEAARCGVDFIQLREKDLSVHDLEVLGCEAVQVVCAARSGSRLLINSRTDVAIASQADGVHLRSNDISPAEVREIYNTVQEKVTKPVIGVSCHDNRDVMRAASGGASFAVFATVFEKESASANRPVGLGMLGQVCLQKIPVLALGGVTVENAAACIQTGAAGVAGIRLFQCNNLCETVAKLRKIA